MLTSINMYRGLGAVGALAFTLLLDMLTPLALGRFWVEVPKSLRVDFKGFPGRAVTSRDILHYLMTELGEMGALNMVVEMGGEGAGQIGIDGRMTLCGCSLLSARYPPSSVLMKGLRATTGKFSRTSRQLVHQT